VIKRPKAAYIHIPFCVSKCWYCDFSSYPGLEPIFQDYVRALISEIERPTNFPPCEGGTEGGEARPGLDTVYFGGGTPTVLSSPDLSAILGAIRGSLGIAEAAEVTIEANPGTVDEAKLRDLREAGFNRLSLGVQSLDDEFLRAMGRVHTRAQALRAYDAARRAGFANVGIDLIFALPGQTLAHWSNTLDSAIGLAPEHVSLYELSIEEGTRFAQLCAEGKLPATDEDAQLAMYELAIDKLTGAGYEHYEVSNFARPGFRSRHNTVYWLNEPYYGFGAGASSCVSGTRARRIASPSDYISAIDSDSDAIEFSETLEPRARLGETIVQGLRMLEGVELARVRRETGFDVLREFAAQIASLRERGLIEVADGHLRVTHAGLLLLNDVSREFV
jgi:oxygen-independent coproporphyrinogen-3 oxidase